MSDLHDIPPEPDSDAGLEIARLRRALAGSEARAALGRAQTQHRVRNLLSVIRAINSRSFELAVSLEDLAMHQSGRIFALARVEEALDLSAGAHADLERLLWEEWLVVVSGPDEVRVQARGPRVALKARAAERIALAFHELTTNALKFGALSGREGVIDVEWTLDSDCLRIAWVERGVPLLTVSPRRSGFGRDLVEHALPYDLDARTSFALLPGGVRVEIELPAARNVDLDTSRRRPADDEEPS